MEKDTIKMTVDPKDLKGLYQAFKTLDKKTNEALKVEVRQLSDYIARQMKMEAAVSPFPDQANIVAQTVRANKDRIPNITVGGSKIARVSRKATSTNPLPKVGELLFGNEFGATRAQFKNGGKRFPKWSGRYGGGSRGWWIFPTLRRLQPKIVTDYHAIIDKYIRKDW